LRFLVADTNNLFHLHKTSEFIVKEQAILRIRCIKMCILAVSVSARVSSLVQGFQAEMDPELFHHAILRGSNLCYRKWWE